MKIEAAKISFNEQGTPVADAFDDVYFSNDSGIDETHYVFIEGNQLLDKWKACTKAHFTIAETGFGTGLNFLLTWQLFLQFKQENPHAPLNRLYFISTEKFPMTVDDLKAALAQWTSLSDLAKLLCAEYPALIEGAHRLNFTQGDVLLDLHFGDAQTSFSRIYRPCDGLVNAWFLDGFAPSKNNTMWSPELFQQFARLSQLEASFATFTSAGIVKRGLQEQGFEIKKIKGFGRKREMLVGSYKQTTPSNLKYEQQHPAFIRPAIPVLSQDESAPVYANPPKSIAIIGGGIASAILAVKLIQRGCTVELICKDAAVAQGASGNPLGGFYPQLNAEAGLNSQVQVHSFLYARRFYDELINQGFNFSHDWCGVLQLGFNANQLTRIKKLRDNAVWPDSVINFVEPQEASDIAKLDIQHPALFIKNAGWISPPELVQACINYCNEHASQRFTLTLNTALIDYQFVERGDEEGHESSCELCLEATDARSDIPVNKYSKRVDSVVFASGPHSDALLKKTLPFRLTRGQVEHIKASEKSAPLATVLCHKGYMTPSVNGYHALGSTYVKEDMESEVRLGESHKNVEMHQSALNKSQWLNELTEQHLQQSPPEARAAVRCSLPDHLPCAGSVPDIEQQKTLFADLYKAKKPFEYPCAEVSSRVFCLTGLGSRGLTTAPMLAEILACQMMQEPLPLQNDLLDNLNPNRFLIRALIRRQSYLNE